MVGRYYTRRLERKALGLVGKSKQRERIQEIDMTKEELERLLTYIDGCISTNAQIQLDKPTRMFLDTPTGTPAIDVRAAVIGKILWLKRKSTTHS